MADATGSIAVIARYPVKSMLGETLEACEVTGAGLLGDRGYAVVDRTDGTVASAKNPRKWGRLLECAARYVEPPGGGAVPPVEVEFPDGSAVRSDDARLDDALRSLTGRDATLVSAAPAEPTFEEVWPHIDGLAPAEFIEHTTVDHEPGGEPVSRIALAMAAPPGTFFDVATLHVLTTSTLHRLGEVAPDTVFEWQRYRPNVVLDVPDAGFVENGWSAQAMELGDEVRARVSIPTMRCVMTTLRHGDVAPADRATLQTIAAANRVEIPGLGTWACAGVYADVTSPGTLSVGATVTVGGP